MIKFDFHVHTVFSPCGIHTILELIAEAKRLGMSGFAATDHGLSVGIGGGRLNNTFYERFKSPCPEVKVVKGIECNVVDSKGKIDFPEIYKKFIELVLLGFHPNTEKDLGKDAYTDMMIAAICANPRVDIISHPNDINYPVDYVRLAKAAKEHGVALELNNSKILYARTPVQPAMDLITACKETGCAMAVNSDTHAIHELGLDDSVRPLLKEANFPEELIVNRDEESALAFIASRRKNKGSCGGR